MSVKVRLEVTVYAEDDETVDEVLAMIAALNIPQHNVHIHERSRELES